MKRSDYTPQESTLRRLERQMRYCEEELAQIKAGREPVKRPGPPRFQPRKKTITETPGLLETMHRHHVGGMNLSQLEQKFGYQDANIKQNFLRAGLKVIIVPKAGCFVKTMRRLSDAELLALARKQKRVCVPVPIKTEWREWTMEKRAWFIAEMRRHLQDPHERPQTPFSANVEPFDYTTPNCHALMERKNGGKSSHVMGCKIKIGSQGVIWNDELWFWQHKVGYQFGMPWTPERGRPQLHRVIYETHHGPIPSHCVVRHADGNPNNLDPANLVLATRNDVARENQAEHHLQKSRLKTTALLQLNQKPNHELARLLGQPRSGGTRTHAAA